MTPPVVDLFGEVIITTQDIDAWLLAVPHIEPRTRHAHNYIKAYDVVNKIRLAKLRGTFDETVRLRECPEHWWARFHWH